MPAPTAFSLQTIRQHLTLVVTAFVILVLAILASIFHTSIQNQLNAWKLLPQPERLTELYFTHPNSLPSTYSIGKSLPVDFTVHNLEYRTTKYTYQVVEQHNSGATIQKLASGSFTLQQNQSAHPKLNVQLVDGGSRTKVVIELTNVNESIDYWVNRNAS